MQHRKDAPHLRFRPVLVGLSEPVLTQLDRLADARGEPRSVVVRAAIRRLVEDERLRDYDREVTRQ